MSWTFRIKQRNKVAIALAAVFLIIVLANWFVNYSMTLVSQQFKSVYADRLVPALDISAMQERYYQSRFLLEQHVQTEGKAEKGQLAQQMGVLRTEFDSLAKKFEATYLTAQEKDDLERLQQADEVYNRMQRAIVALSMAGDKGQAQAKYKQTGLKAFQGVMEPLHALSGIQEEVGLELYSDAERQMKSLKVLSYLVIALAVILALLVGTLLQTSRKLRHLRPQHFHLN